MDKINIWDFITKGDPWVKRTATYSNLKIVSEGEGGNRHVTFYVENEERFYMWVDTHCESACFIHSERGRTDDILSIYERHGNFDSWFWRFKTIGHFEDMFLELINMFRT